MSKTSVESPLPDGQNTEKMTSERDTQESDSEEKRPVWDNQVQFILSTIGLSVGLGNIWRFPAMAYKNGGSAFLFPYLLCAAFVALPLIYMEFIVGQYTSSSPALAIRKYAPAFEGLGWAMAILNATLAIYYILIIAWTAIYIAWIVMGKQAQWTTCDNYWNTETCFNADKNNDCRAVNASMVFWNGTECTNSSEGLRSAAEEFFQNNIIHKSSGFAEIGRINWETLVALLVIWIMVYLIVIKGIKYIGYASYVTSTIPYVIIAIMFVRGVTLDGAADGIYYYLGAPQWEKLLDKTTWLQAIIQLIFSISIGYGSLISLASYSKKKNNCFRDALILIAGDTFMSVFGGVAVFATLGYMAKILNKRIDQVVESGLTLAFVAYPQAISSMPVPALWAFLFFLMLLLLGLSSEIALVEVCCSSIYDQFPATRKKKWLVSLCVCSTYFLIGAIFATGSGWYWFRLYSEYVGTTSSCFIVALEAIIVRVFYGIKNYRKDQIAMFGPPGNKFFAIFGPSSYYWGFALIITCPIVVFTAGIAITYGFYKDGSLVEMNGETVVYTYPIFAMVFGWFLNLAPLVAIPILFCTNFVHNLREGKGFFNLFKVQEDHPSYARIHGTEAEDETATNTHIKSEKNSLNLPPLSVVDNKSPMQSSQQGSSILAV